MDALDHLPDQCFATIRCLNSGQCSSLSLESLKSNAEIGRDIFVLYCHSNHPLQAIFPPTNVSVIYRTSHFLLDTSNNSPILNLSKILIQLR